MCVCVRVCVCVCVCVCVYVCVCVGGGLQGVLEGVCSPGWPSCPTGRGHWGHRGFQNRHLSINRLISHIPISSTQRFYRSCFSLSCSNSYAPVPRFNRTCFNPHAPIPRAPVPHAPVPRAPVPHAPVPRAPEHRLNTYLEEAKDTIMGGVQCLNALLLAPKSVCVEFKKGEKREKNENCVLRKIIFYCSVFSS